MTEAFHVGCRRPDPCRGWLRWVEINDFRNIRPTVLNFDRKRNVIIGPSGSGKTTLLKLIAMAATSNFSGLEREIFGITYELGTIYGTIRVAMKTHGFSDWFGSPAVDGSELRIPNPMPAALWSYEITTTTFGQPSYWVRANCYEARCGRIGGTEEASIAGVDPFRPDFIWRVFNQLHTFSQSISDGPPVPYEGHNMWMGYHGIRCSGRFDEALGAFHTMVGRGVPARTADEIAPPQMSFHMDGSHAFSNHNISVPECITYGLTHADPPATTSRLGPEHLAFLARALEVLELPGGEMHLDFASRVGSERMGEELRYDRVGFKLTLHDGASVSHDGLSFGQKRVLSFLYHLAASEDIVLADELSNGLHPAWLAACLESIAPRQAFLTTQRPHLFDHLAFDSAEALARSVIACRREGQKVVIKPVDASAAELLFRTAKARAEGTEALREAKLF